MILRNMISTNIFLTFHFLLVFHRQETYEETDGQFRRAPPPPPKEEVRIKNLNRILC
jgi:hypothetical protein